MSPTELGGRTRRGQSVVARFPTALGVNRSRPGTREHLEVVRVATSPPLYGPQQSRFARYLERREERRPDQHARELRRKLIARLRGRVLELGCGDGRAFEHYRPGVEHVLAVEPDDVARAVATQRARDAAVPIEVVEGSAEALPAEDGTFDAAVVVWVLCSVADPAAALGELRRVLKPGGELHFY